MFTIQDRSKIQLSLHTDLYVSPAAAPAGPPAAHQAVWDRALPAGRHGAGVLCHSDASYLNSFNRDAFVVSDGVFF